MKKHQRDRGRELGDLLTSKLDVFDRFKRQEKTPEKQGLLDDASSLDGSDYDESLPAYRSQDSSPKLRPQADAELAEPRMLESVKQPQEAKVFTKPVIMNIVSYGILAL